MSTKMTTPAPADASRRIRIVFHGGDNMLGRAVQLTLPKQSPGEAEIRDSCSAQHYLNMALDHPSYYQNPQPTLEQIRQQNVHAGSFLWGDSPDVLSRVLQETPADLLVWNLETAVTTSIGNPDIPTYKGINYHLHGDNFETVVQSKLIPDSSSSTTPMVVSFANNHVMDFGRQALEEESLPLFQRLQSIDPKLHIVGCGRDFRHASRPVTIQNDKKTLQVFSMSAECSGTPKDWFATDNRSGLVGLPGLYDTKSVEEAIGIVRRVFDQHHRPENDNKSDVFRIVSIHWGPNWALRNEKEEQLRARQEFAHRLIDNFQVDLIYGHSSHHCRGMEVYKGKLILYGTGDIINDYEGFENAGEEKYNRLGGIYVVDYDSSQNNFQQLQIVPMFMDRLRLTRYTSDAKIWSPRKRMLEPAPNKCLDFCQFINRLSKTDACGDANGALLMEHVDSSEPQIHGPILRSKLYEYD